MPNGGAWNGTSTTVPSSILWPSPSLLASRIRCWKRLLCAPARSWRRSARKPRTPCASAPVLAASGRGTFAPGPRSGPTSIVSICPALRSSQDPATCSPHRQPTAAVLRVPPWLWFRSADPCTSSTMTPRRASRSTCPHAAQVASVTMMDDAKQRGRDELAAMDRNRGRFGLEHDNARNLSRVVDLSVTPHVPLSDWMDHEAAPAIRDDYL